MEDWNRKTIFYGHYRSILNHCDIIGLQICRIRWKKTQNKGYYGVQGHSRSVPIENQYATFLSVTNSNWHPISYRFGDTAACCSNFGTLSVFEPPFGGLRDNVRCSSWAHWKARMDFPLVLIELFSLGVTAESLQAKRSNRRFRCNAVSLIQNFR